MTSDGTCGPLHGNSICGSWHQGSCCSSSGFCGSDEDDCGDSCISGPCDSSTHDSGPSEDVYIDPSIWSGGSSIINCIPPCNYILPPFTLETTTTITFPLYTTSLEVAWSTTKVKTLANGHVSTSKGIWRTTKKTTLTIPPVTTNQINLWNVHVPSGAKSSLISLTTSILPPPFTITDDRNPDGQPGVTHPIVVRTITPPPWPYSTDVPDGENTGSHPSTSFTKFQGIGWPSHGTHRITEAMEYRQPYSQPPSTSATGL